MLYYKKHVHIKINAILNKTNILQFFDGRDHLLAISVEQQHVHNPFVKIKYDKTIIAKIFVLLIICICDFINKVKNILTEYFLKQRIFKFIFYFIYLVLLMSFFQINNFCENRNFFSKKTYMLAKSRFLFFIHTVLRQRR